MAVLARSLALLALAGCYSPDVRDCTVQCSAADDCAAGQRCGADGFCAAPERAGTCARTPELSDGGIPLFDAPADGAPDGPPHGPPDAAPPQDATFWIPLQITITGKGRVTLATQACADECTFWAIAGVPVTLVARPDMGQQLETWSGACAGHDPTCAMTPTMPVTIGAKFKKHHGDGEHD